MDNNLNMNGILDATEIIADSFSELIGTMISGFEKVMELTNNIINLFQSFIDLIFDGGTIIEAFRNLVAEAWQVIQEAFLSGWDSVLKPVFEGLTTAFLNVIELGIVPLSNSWQEFIETAIGQIFLLWNSIQQTIGNILSVIQPVISFITSIPSLIQETINTVFSELNTFTGDVFKKVLSLLQIVTGIIASMIKGIVTYVSELINQVFRGLENLLPNIIIGIFNAVIRIINSMIRKLNKTFKFELPDWIPFIGGKKYGLNLDELEEVKRLAKGGDLMNGIAMVGEAGPELLLQNGTRTTVAPLTRGGGADPVDIIDYNKMAQIFMHSVMGMMDGVSVKMDRREFGKLVSEVNK
ncbi:hypothetical protein M2475_000918 [Breznakia sp. PF5-3]|uniref:phage tail protein n=1 Tax=unclassified Breznakia TaxID=2623764 RepID=UPI0024056108|nr:MULTISPECIES: hypothetical protein [unclassified Breznakia]MDF9824690.1 hypothetical protein [Breznakia sp. PM6-1]MDF9835353.1 hypothetical protein [Breznakia sp. PF5-3]MDF9836952.1 hypothetical protein [Breznakia sp. PFB2-8]MDF9859588.1 hypothetical protein [Breznakia sp. PH5-24]